MYTEKNDPGKIKLKLPLDRKSLGKRKKKYRLWKRFMETGDGSIYKEYCRCRNQVRRLTRKATRDYEKEVARQVKTNCKSFWTYVNRKTKVKSTISDLD